MKLDKTYQPQEFEKLIYALWEQKQVFLAHPDSKKNHFSISMPPPNETGTLGVHHALFLTLQDIIVRHNRLKGNDVLWLPGTDHAALAVNSLIEKQLTNEGLSKHDIGREEFLRRTKEFVAGSRGTMLSQMRAVGASPDWSRLRYTLDDTLVRVVNETFIAMYNKGLIYRGKRIVNWDPNLETTVSDDEVEYKLEKTKMYYLKFGPFEIATTRPETKFGDKYVVMHPDDQRYSQYNSGDTFTAEWINGTVQATVIKDEVIDPNMGTGVMTITPWHSEVDFDIAIRHNLDFNQIIDFHGNLMDNCGEFSGMNIRDARPKIIDKLTTKNLVTRIEDNYEHNLAVNSRGGGIIEPQIKLQWFIDVNKPVINWKGSDRSFKQILTDVIKEKDIEIIPSRFEKTYFNWINNLKDWCISRQIWWGHRIPVWYRQDTDGREEIYCGLIPPEDQSEGFHEWEQDPDTLDTWFSSSLWTFSTLVDPAISSNLDLSFEDLLKKSLDFQTYHPTNVLETGWDIIFFWVARMILSTTFMTGQVPFKQVYLHGLVRTSDGQKMSKSRPESIINPIDIIDKYGADALRIALITGVSPGNDQIFSIDKVLAGRNFCNKLWNIARFIEGAVDLNQPLEPLQLKSDADNFIVSKINSAQLEIARLLDNYNFWEAFDILYRLVWNDYADWYVEFSKQYLNRELLLETFTSILRLVHPFAPFVSEAIWQTLEINSDQALASETYLNLPNPDFQKQVNFEEIKNIIIESRDIVKKTSANGLTLYYKPNPVISQNADIIKRLAFLKDVSEVSDGNGFYLTSTKFDCWLDIDKFTISNYLSNLSDKITKSENSIKLLSNRLDNQDYIAKAPKQLIEQTKNNLEEEKRYLTSLNQEKERFTA